MPGSGSSRHAAEIQLEELRGRADMMLSAFERTEPGPVWEGLRAVLDRTSTAGGLRSIVRDLRSMRAGLPTEVRRALVQELRRTFGPDPDEAKDLAVVARVKARGGITSEREYRIVQAFADALEPDEEQDSERLALGGMLDAYMARA